jgi:two-component system sensor histidine kinase ChiS
LRRITREIALGNMELPFELKSRDEIGQLGRDFGTMTRKLKGYLADITALTAASARFVPRDFIDLLEVEDLTKLKLGDQTRREMTVLFSSILNFRKITGHMSSQGVFHYLNSYLTSVVPPIRDNKGFIDKYVGDTYMALFPRTPRDALTAFKLVNRRMAHHNRQRLRSGSEGLFLSFGIHKGPLMLGIVGEEERLEGTVISDAVNLTSRLNGLCRLYRVPCVTTFDTMAQAPGFPFRKIDHVMVKGKTEPVLICEPLDELDPEKAVLMDHMSTYVQSFEAFERGDLKVALDGFEFLKTRDPHDTVVQKHAARCQQILATGMPEVWNPAVQFHEK